MCAAMRRRIGVCGTRRTPSVHAAAGRAAGAAAAAAASWRPRRQHVFDGDAPAFAAALDLVGRETALGEQAANGRAHPVDAAAARACAARDRLAVPRPLARRRVPPRLPGCAPRRRARARRPARRPRLRPRRSRRARHRRRRHFHRHLVGLDLDQRFMALHRLADGLQPALHLRPGALHLVGGQQTSINVAHRSDTRNAAHRRDDITNDRAAPHRAGPGMRARDVRHREPLDRRVEVEKRMFGERRRDLGAEAGGDRVLVHDQAAARLRDRGEHRVPVPGRQRAQVEQLDVDARIRRPPARSARPSRPS